MAKPKPIPKSAFGIPEYNDPDPMDNLKMKLRLKMK